ncbi:MAG: zinc ribbon domain-containing protein [Clostridia bacterium]|nr:zinc ribbon domain-containing protein [Clostridia bacterium]
MAFKRALWTSGYTYRLRCPICGTAIEYTDRQLGFRAWYPNGFVYCPGCRKPQRHSEFFAVYPDGTPVYKTRAEADRAIVDGYYRSIGVQVPAGAYDEEARAAAGTPTPAAGTAPAAEKCPSCGADVLPGSKYCSRCGTSLEKEKIPVCPGCGRNVPKDTYFCPYCGTKQNDRGDTL